MHRPRDGFSVANNQDGIEMERSGYAVRRRLNVVSNSKTGSKSPTMVKEPSVMRKSVES